MPSDRDGRLPPVLPIVLYNGRRPWTAPREMGELIAPVDGVLAPYQPTQRYLLVDLQRWLAEHRPEHNLVSALAELESGRGEGQWPETLRRLFGWLAGPEDEEVRRAFAEWTATALRQEVEGASPQRVMELVEGRATMFVDRVREWAEECRRQGRMEGIEEGIEQGRAEEQALLCRMAQRKFDARTGERLSRLLAGETDAQRLARVGEWIIECETGAELLARTGGD